MAEDTTVKTAPEVEQAAEAPTTIPIMLSTGSKLIRIRENKENSARIEPKNKRSTSRNTFGLLMYV